MSRTPAPKNGTEKLSQRGKIKSEFPKHTLEQTLRVPQAIEDANGGKPMPPLDVAQAIGVSPGSSDFRVLLSSSFKYGLTDGSYKSDRISLVALGTAIVAPSSPEESQKAKSKAGLSPTVFRQIFDYYKGKKLPEQKFFENSVVREFGVPKEHATTCVKVFLQNVQYLGMIRTLTSGQWLSADATLPDLKAETGAEEDTDGAARDDEDEEDVAKRVAGIEERIQEEVSKAVTENRKVFITHGKNREIVGQIKELLTYGKFEPVVSVERDTTSIPVPEKVFDDMRECSAGIIHVMSEGVLKDAEGKEVPRINENVLIEIGAAIALYRKKFILLVQRGVKLPSNLQGLYRCEYEGDKLDYEATMKLLKTFNQFREKEA